MQRELIRIKSQDFEGFGCSACSWLFKSSGAPVGKSLDEMKKFFEAQRDKEFAAHICIPPSKPTPLK